MAFTYDSNSPWLSQTLPEGALEKLMSGGQVQSFNVPGLNQSGYYQYVPRFETDWEGRTTDRGQDDYIRGPQDNGLYGMWDKTGKFLGYGQAQETGGVLGEMMVPLIAAVAMAYGIPALMETAGAIPAGTTGAGFVGEGALSGIGAWDTAMASALPSTGAVGAAGGMAAYDPSLATIYSNAEAAAAAGGNPAYSLAGSAGAPAAPGLQASVGGSGALASTSGAPGLVGTLPTAVGTSAAATGAGSMLSNLGSAASGGISSLGDLFKDGKTLADLGMIGAGIGGAIQGNHQQQNQQNMIGNFLSRWDNFYAPGTNEYNLLKQEMERKDAAAGRNSQYGTRLAEMGGRIAQAKFNSLPSMFSTATGANANAMSNNTGLSQIFTALGNAAQSGTLSKIFGAL